MENFRKSVASAFGRGTFVCPFDSMVGIEPGTLADGLATLSLDATALHHNPTGVLHGAVLAGMMDSAMAYAVSSILAEDETCTNVEFSVRLLRATTAGRLVATARVIRSGKTVVPVEAFVNGQDGEVVATGASTYIRRRALGGTRWLPPVASPK